MALEKQLWDFWKLHEKVWGPYFRSAGLDLTRATRKSLPRRLRQKIKINHKLKGLEEFSGDGCRGVEPGDPPKSLFYHIFASPHVLPANAKDVDYPTMADLEIIENYVYSEARLSFTALEKRAAGRPLAIVVFAYEYAPARDTVHRRHADLCFSRTGISRIGNVRAHYVPQARGFFPHSGVKKKVHVVPARFGAFVAVQQRENPKTIGPMRFSKGDESRRFWVPIHKLFSGPECITGLHLKVEISAHHLNEKIKRVHLALQNEGYDTGWRALQMERTPFRITRNLARFSASEGLLKPVPHDPLVAPARTARGKLVGFPVPRDHSVASASLCFPEYLEAARWPEFVHVKHEINRENPRRPKITYLPNTTKDIQKVIKRGGYEAANFVDYTADGWVRVSCTAIPSTIPKLAAYSILGQPDFFPLVKQQDLIEWWENNAPKEIKESIWADKDTTPTPLSGSRLPANFTLDGADFDSTDTTISAIISMDRKPGRKPRPQGFAPTDTPRRETTLSYRATNLFAPGWDSAQDVNRDRQSKGGTFHLANYGLGSPYPEDTLICAALGSFWPGAVPDMTRFFAIKEYPSVTPIVDDLAGWDGLMLPKNVGVHTEYMSFAYADYVKAILDNEFVYETFAEVGLEDYIRRTLVTARVFQVLGVTSSLDRARYSFTSFRNPTHAEWTPLQRYGWTTDRKLTYRIEIGRFPRTIAPRPRKPRVIRVKLDRPRVFFASTCAVAREDPKHRGKWLVDKF